MGTVYLFIRTFSIQLVFGFFNKKDYFLNH